MTWCLIAHPTREGLHYRISKKWLCEDIPSQDEDIPSQDRTSAKDLCKKPIPIEALEKVAVFLRTLSCSDHESEKAKSERTGERRGREDLGGTAKSEKRRGCRQAILCGPGQGREELPSGQRTEDLPR